MKNMKLYYYYLCLYLYLYEIYKIYFPKSNCPHEDVAPLKRREKYEIIMERVWQLFISSSACLRKKSNDTLQIRGLYLSFTDEIHNKEFYFK